MGDLISREAVLEALRARSRELQNLSVTSFEKAISLGVARECVSIVKAAPAVDAVEVVRCKDCAYRMNERKCPMCWSEWVDDSDGGQELLYWDNTTDDGFCHRGAKTGGEEKDAVTDKHQAGA